MEPIPPGTAGSATQLPELSPNRVTAQDVERARAEEKAAYTQLMDAMEASVGTQGPYFVKLGQKRPINQVRRDTTAGFMGLGKRTSEREETVGYEDDRALILKAPITHEWAGTTPEDFIVVTPDGIFAIRFYHSEIDNPASGDQQSKRSNYDTIIALISGKQTPDDSSRYVGRQAGDWRGSKIESSRKFGAAAEGERSWPSSIGLTELNAAIVSESFQHAVRESINVTESPNKKHVEEAVVQKKLAEGAATMIGSLPPRE